MLGHLSFGVRDLERATKFYDGILAPLDAALNAGGSDAGPPGPRPRYGDTYYAAFVIDPEAVHQ
jgi:catechol 2,3-dioxygenase-like lactoylglutathione lyase family enzyme